MAEAESEMLFDLTLSDEQRMTRESVQRFAQTEMTPIARSADEACAPPDDFYQRTQALGLALMVIPESLGGAGMPRSPLTNMLNAEDLAQGDMALAMGALTPLSFINAVLDNGTEEQQENLLGRFVDDQFRVATIALMEPGATFSPQRFDTSAVPNGDGYLLNGVKSMVPLAGDAELMLVIATVDDSVQGFVVTTDQPGVTVAKEEYMGLHALDLGRVTLDQVEVNASARLGEAQNEFALGRLLDLGRIGISAMAVGVCQATLDYVIPYCNERVAFGEPITNRQSVAFMIGDMATELEAMRLMVYRAAALAEQGQDFHKQSHLARLQCARYAMRSGTNGVQLLGGHGFIREHPVELWYRNLRAVGLLEGHVVI
jgi:alkylation response protein AidB-like acyl-CoA dehydrogenase